MKYTPSCAILSLVCFCSMVSVVGAQTRGQRAPSTTAKPASTPAGWLGSPDRQEPSPTITSLKGVGTANAMAEARLTPQELSTYCKENVQLFESVAACLKQKQNQYGTKIFRASADCTVGRITTTGDQSYTLDGLWDQSDIGAGRTRWRDAEGNVVGRDLITNGLHISQQWETLCPAPVTAAFLARVGAQAAARPPSQTRAPEAPPALCGGEPLCTEVNDFAATIIDFRASLTQPRKVLTVSMRFENKTDHPVMLGYVPASGVATDERSNRYGSYDPDVRGIGLIGRTVDAKFVLQPGQRSDARFTYYWDAGRTIYGTVFDVELVVREILPAPNNQVTLGAEYPLRFPGLVNGARPGVSTSSSSSSAAPAVATPAPSPAPTAAASDVDRCAGVRTPCYDAGLFTATVTGLAGSLVGGRHHTLRVNLEIKNNADQQIILAYKSATNSAIDNLGNAYYWGRAGTYDGSVQGIGIMIPGRSADLQFRLAPNSARSAVINVIRYEAGRQPLGTSWALDTVLAELRVLPNGTQSETVREHSVHLADLAIGGRGAVAAPSAETIKKAGEAIRGIFGGKK